MAAGIETPITDASAWKAETLVENDGLFTLNEACLAEIDAVAAFLKANPLPTEALTPEHVTMPACAVEMAKVRGTLVDGAGFAVVERIPLDSLGREIASQIYWLLMSLITRPVAQKWDGTMVYDVTDTGLQDEPGNGVRSSKTRNGQYYHTDNAFNLPPNFVALFCLHPAKKGGSSGVISMQTVYNILLKESPGVLPRLFQPFYFDRQHEHAPGDDVLAFNPIFEPADKGVHVRFSRRLLGFGYELTDGGMDDETRTAIDAITDILERPGLGKSFQFERGQIQIVNNRRMGHRREAYEDWPEPDRKRHLVRLWGRQTGGPFYLG